MNQYEDKIIEQREKRSFRKALCASLAVTLLLAGAIGGTYAWLVAETKPVVNTFTYGDIDLTLDETKTDTKGNPIDSEEDDDTIPDRTTEGNTYAMLPGEEYFKDPKVTVHAGNEACWLFIRLEEKGGVTILNEDGSETKYDFDSYLTYEVADGWYLLLDEDGKAVEGVYYQTVKKDWDGTEAAFEVLKRNTIRVKDEVDKDMLNALDENGAVQNAENYPKLIITAYAVQYSGFEPEVTEGATEASEEQVNAAALKAWRAMEKQNTTIAKP